MATAQKRSFRLPWGGDAHRDEPPPDRSDEEMVDQADLAHRLGAVHDELGAGPFGLAGSGPAATPPTEALEDEPAGDEAVADAAADAALVAEASSGADDAAGPDDEGRWLELAPTPEVPANVTERAPLGLERAAWPDSDRRTKGPLSAPSIRRSVDAVADAASEASSASSANIVPATPSPTPRRDNPLVAGLVRAMRDAARAARDETTAALHTDAAARAEGIKVHSAVTVNELKKAAEVDVAAVKDWSRAEQARVREETERRIADRRAQLVAQTEAAARAAEDRLGKLRATVEAFEAEMAGFFEALLAEDDPARVAGLAERMPSAPGLDAFPIPGTPAEAPAHPRRSPPRTATHKPAPTRHAAPAVPAAVVEPEAAETETPTDVESPPEPAAAAEVEDTAPADDEPAFDPTEDPRAGWLDHLDPDAAAAAEAEAIAGLDRQTDVVVSGLGSVAGIASFKATLLQVAGVTAVSVTAGSNGDVLFTVTHEGQTELRDAVRSMEAFEPRLIADDGDSLSIVAREPAA